MFTSCFVPQISQEFIFIKEKAEITLLCSSFRVFNLLLFDTKHDMVHSCMHDQEQFKPNHVRNYVRRNIIYHLFAQI